MNEGVMERRERWTSKMFVCVCVLICFSVVLFYFVVCFLNNNFLFCFYFFLNFLLRETLQSEGWIQRKQEISGIGVHYVKFSKTQFKNCVQK